LPSRRIAELGGCVGEPVDPTTDLRPFVPRLVVEWLRETPDASYREIDGTLAFVDISGFTKMTERLARHGKVGAEEMNDLLDDCPIRRSGAG
jgi:hypothetical protein